MTTGNATESPVAVISGAGSGIGAAVTRLLAEAGYNFCLIGRRLPQLEAVVESVGGPDRAFMINVDITEPIQAGVIADLTASRWGRADVLINNAGLAELKPLAETDESLLQRTFAVNTFAPARLIARLWPLLAADGGGCVINVSSMATVDPFPGLGIYAAAKSALNSLTRSIKVEGDDAGIRSYAIAPGAVETDMLRGLIDEEALPKSATLEPEYVARVIVQCINGKHEAQSGETIVVPSG